MSYDIQGFAILKLIYHIVSNSCYSFVHHLVVSSFYKIVFSQCAEICNILLRLEYIWKPNFVTIWQQYGT